MSEPNTTHIVGLTTPAPEDEGVAAPHGRYVQPMATNRLPPEIVTIDVDHIACDGVAASLGHPRVWLTVDKFAGFIDCSYCDRRFVLSVHAKH